MRGLTRMFANPGSTEVPLLVDLPPDLEFVLGFHEGSVVGIATGWAIGRNEPALVLLHTTAGLGNAVGARATARANRAPLVVLVGQQDRRHLAHAGPSSPAASKGCWGGYPVWVDQPVRPQDVPRGDQPGLARGDDGTRTRRWSSCRWTTRPRRRRRGGPGRGAGDRCSARPRPTRSP